MSQSDVSSFIANRGQDEKRALMQRLLMNDVDDEWLQSDIQKTYSVEFKSDFDQVASGIKERTGMRRSTRLRRKGTSRFFHSYNKRTRLS